MATLVSIKNVNRTPLRLGSVQVPRNGTPVDVDIDDARTLRDMYRHVGRWVLVDDNADTAFAGITADAAEINILDGATLTTAELNKLTGSGAVVASGTQAGNITNATQTGTAVVAANAATQGVAYVQADVQSIATLANANKTAINATVTDVGSLTTKLNSVLAALDAFGITA